MRPQLHFGYDAGDSRDALIGNQHVAEFAAEARAPFYDVAAGDHSAAQSGADDRRNRGGRVVRAEDREVAPERAGVAIVQIGDGLVERARQPARISNPAQPGWTKLVDPRALRTPVGARRARRIQSDDRDIGARKCPPAQPRSRRPSAICPGRPRDPPAKARDARTGLDQESLLRVEKSVVDGGTAQIDSSDKGHGKLQISRGLPARREQESVTCRREDNRRPWRACSRFVRRSGTRRLPRAGGRFQGLTG